MIVVVGSGSSPDGKGLGQHIDCYPVIRMHDSGWQNTEDFGHRINYTVLPGPWGPKIYKDPARLPDQAWLVYTLPTQKPWPVKKTFNGKPVKTHEVKAECKPVYAAGYVPTRGFCAAIMAREILGHTEIALVGFDSLLSGIQTEYSQSAPDEMRAIAEVGKVKNSRHHFGLEAECLKQWAANRGVTLLGLGDL
jgi:hypothetical protein